MTLEAVPPAVSTPEIPKELSDHIQGLKALGAVHDLLQKGTFTHSYRFALDQSIAFIETLHRQSTEEALLHPEADKVPELVAIKESRAKQVAQENAIKKAEEKRVRKASKAKKCPEE